MVAARLAACLLLAAQAHTTTRRRRGPPSGRDEGDKRTDTGLGFLVGVSPGGSYPDRR
jgi:hypothetical protein